MFHVLITPGMNTSPVSGIYSALHSSNLLSVSNSRAGCDLVKVFINVMEEYYTQNNIKKKSSHKGWDIIITQ